MNSGIHTVIYPVKDLEKAKALYSTLLGTEPVVDEPYYVGYQVGDQHFGLDPSGHGGLSGPVTYYSVDAIEQAASELREHGAEQHGEVRDVGGGKLVVALTDPDGNVIALSQDPQ